MRGNKPPAMPANATPVATAITAPRCRLPARANASTSPVATHQAMLATTIADRKAIFVSYQTGSSRLFAGMALLFVGIM
jgi:hypothetical protein